MSYADDGGVTLLKGGRACTSMEAFRVLSDSALCIFNRQLVTFLMIHTPFSTAFYYSWTNVTCISRLCVVHTVSHFCLVVATVMRCLHISFDAVAYT